MRFYTQQHDFYCGIDLHARKMYLCIVDATGEIVFHRNLKTNPEEFRKALKPYRHQDIVIAVESTFNWYWLADLCEDEGFRFLLGHALAMKAIHGGKTKNDKQDSHKIAMLTRGGNLPQAYVYPRKLRGGRDLTRRRGYFVRRRAELQTHVRNTASQYNIVLPTGSLRYQVNQDKIAELFADPAAKLSIQSDLDALNDLSRQIKRLESSLLKMAKVSEPGTFYRLKSIPGVGDILALVILYEIGDIHRFARLGEFLSYSRLVPGKHESAGKQYGSPGRKQGNPHLKWAFSEAITLMIRDCDNVKATLAKWEKRYGKPKALSILAARLGRAVYLILKRGDVFDESKFLRVEAQDDRLVAPTKRRGKRKSNHKEKAAAAS